jgi:hypothetical protein
MVKSKRATKAGRVDRVEVRAVHGKARLEHVLYLLGYKQINTSVVERHNGPCRLRNNARCARLWHFPKRVDITGGCVGCR